MVVKFLYPLNILLPDDVLAVAERDRVEVALLHQPHEVPLQLPRLLHVGVQLVAGRGRVVKQEGAAVGQLAAPGNTTTSIRTISI